MSQLQTAPREVQADISRIVKYAPERLIGREADTALLNDAWDKAARGQKGRPHILTFVALGGEGKTSLVANWAAELAYQGWPSCDAAFAWSFYSQGTREQQAASSDLFLKEALNFFGNEKNQEFAASNAGAYEKGQRLARTVGRGRNLLILDGLEPLQYAPTSPTAGELKDGGLAALLKGLATTSRGLCVITTRYSIADLKGFKEKILLEKELKSLSRQAGVNLLQSLGVAGTLLRNNRLGKEFVNEYEKLVEDVNGHALTLNLLGTYLRDAHGGDIRKRDLVKLSEADAEEQGGHAFRVMEAYERAFEEEGDKGRRALAILRLLGLFDRPMTYDCFGALLQEPSIEGLTDPLMGLTDGQLNIALSRLQSAKLITVNRDAGGLVSIDAHPLLREYFAKQLNEKNPDGWRSAHRRLYEHLCDTTNESDKPTLEDLQPLYQAIAHGCQAGLQREVVEKLYYKRILRENEMYSISKLGTQGLELGAIAWFFDQPWSRVSNAFGKMWESWLLNEAAMRLRALGRLTEAIEPLRTGLGLSSKAAEEARDESFRLYHLEEAALRASNLSELQLTRGEVRAAVEHAEQSVTYADFRDHAFRRMASRATYADALHQAGRRSEALENFRQAEKIHQEWRPNYLLLYSLSGFWYCDLLLTAAERAAWQKILQLETQNSKLETLTAPCRAVSQRALQTIKIAERNNWLLEIALDHLTLGRAALYATILDHRRMSFQAAADNPKRSSSSNRGKDLRPPEASPEMESAVEAGRRANRLDYLPNSLITRAWLRFHAGAQTGPESAQEDLDEAWEIAERGPMKLFMADIHLYRARLFHAVKPYPWDKFVDGREGRGPKDDLAAAKKFINDCGYHRRDEELQDAEEAAKDW